MLKKYPGFNLLFAILLIIGLIAEYTAIGNLTILINAAISLSLMVMLAIRTKLKGRFHKRVFAGLVFAIVGNTLLTALNEPSWINYGLVSFLICYLFYISAFYLDFRSAPELDKKGARIAILLCALFSISFYFYLRPHLGSMRLTVMAYTLVISMMIMMAAFRNKRVNSLSFNLVLSGVLCLLLSNVLLAYHQFIDKFDFSGLLITGIYSIAQYLITMGTIERKLINQD